MKLHLRSAVSLAALVFAGAGLVLHAAGCAGSDSSDESAPDSGILGADSSSPVKDGSSSSDAGGGSDANSNTDADAAPVSTYSVKVTVTGLAAGTGDAGLDDAGAGGLVLANGTEKLAIFQNGTFTFVNKLTAGAAFDVTIAAQPTNPSHECTVSGGKGTVVAGDVESITVNCSVEKFTVGGNVTGLAGSGLQLRINNTENVSINIVDGTYAFPTSLASGTHYDVEVLNDPTNRWQTCVLENATGIVDDANVANVNVTCTTKQYTISGTITGLITTGLSLKDTYSGGGGPETISPAANATTFSFVQTVKSGETYAVSVETSPVGFGCGVTANGSGTVAGSNISVSVACAPSDQDFASTGAEQTYTVPSWAHSIDVTLEGAQGGTDFGTSTNYGGKLTATLAVTPADTLYIYVGSMPSDTSGGFNGGGAGDNGGRGGGGASDIRVGGNALANRVLVAGGGGGAGIWVSGGNLEVVGGQGGDLVGGNGYRVPSFAANAGGTGGTQSGSGVGTCVNFNQTSVSGGLGFGGTTVGKGCGCQGYGGGGGYYGGSASGNCRGGGGGSAFALVDASITNVVHTIGGAQPGNGRVKLVVKP